jgi:threonine dehydratase
MARSLAAGRRVQLHEVGLFSDGTAVKIVGEETFRLCRQYVDEVVLVDTDAICAAIKDVFQDTRSILEPAGALSVAGMKVYAAREKLKGKTLIGVATGANMNFARLRFVAERTEVGEAREALFAVTIPEERGSFRRFCELVGARNVTEFNYRISDERIAHVFVGIGTASAGDNEKIAKLFRGHGYATVDLTHDEMAEEHVRYMVGGKSTLAAGEVLYRFEFPERPGALMNFLTTMGPTWNISMFHYRNQGADYSRVLVGLQGPRGERKAFKDFLATLGYRHSEETENPAYKLFLA